MNPNSQLPSCVSLPKLNPPGSAGICLSTLDKVSLEAVWNHLLINHEEFAIEIYRTLSNPMIKSLIEDDGATVSIDRSWLSGSSDSDEFLSQMPCI